MFICHEKEMWWGKLPIIKPKGPMRMTPEEASESQRSWTSVWMCISLSAWFIFSGFNITYDWLDGMDVSPALTARASTCLRWVGRDAPKWRFTPVYGETSKDFFSGNWHNIIFGSGEICSAYTSGNVKQVAVEFAPCTSKGNQSIHVDEFESVWKPVCIWFKTKHFLEIILIIVNATYIALKLGFRF